MQAVKLIECPRDAMQGYAHFIATPDKIRYENLLLKVGFHSLDFGSFVSPRSIPQMQDTEEVLESLDTTATKLLAIIANYRGAEKACSLEKISCLGFPFSVSETFQQRNTNATIEEAFLRVQQIQQLCKQSSKELVIYISMGFGNPYGDPWDHEVVETWVEKMVNLGVGTISLSDTIGVANPDSIAYLFSHLSKRFPDTEFGAHLHTLPNNWREKVDAAFENGCRRFDGALKGYGGCPMAADKLTGNMPTENLVDYFAERNISTGIDPELFARSLRMAGEIFS